MKREFSGHITKPEPMCIIESGNKIQFYTDAIENYNTLDFGQVYNFNADREKGLMWLSKTTKLSVPEKLYDFDQDFRDQVLTTLRTPGGSNNIGVLLEGYKGQGKSVIAKQLAIESGLPIILINSSITVKADFVSFLNEIKQDYVLLIDEFEKFFPGNTNEANNEIHNQDSFLAFLSGAIGLNNKRLVIFTANDSIGDKFINRPGRIRYRKKFNFMPKKVFDAIVLDKLKNKAHQQDLEDNLDIYSCTIDILTSIIDEINIHDKSYSSFKEFFNHSEREITYSKYRREADGSWKFIEDIRSKREIGVENEYAQSLLGYNAAVKHNDGETIIYEMRDYVDPDSDDDKKAEEVKIFTFKLVKQLWNKASTNLVF